MELTVDQALQQGVEAHKEGKLEEAERLYKAILQSQPLHPDANHNLGVLAVSVNKTEAALPLFRTAIEVDPKIEQFWLSYIDALIKEKQFYHAKQVIEQAKKQVIGGDRINSLEIQLSTEIQKPNTVCVTPPQKLLDNLLGHYKSGRLGDAEKLSVKITQDFPNHQFAWKVLGVVFGTTGRKLAAVEANQAAVTLSPQDPEAHSNLGNTLKDLGRLDEAESSYNKAIALRPKCAKTHCDLGITLQKLGRLTEAEASYTRAIVLDPKYAEAHTNLGNTLKDIGRVDEAKACYSLAIELQPDCARANFNLGVLFQEINKLKEAEKCYSRAIFLKQDFVHAHTNLGVILQRLGRLDEAKDRFTQVIELSRGSAEAHYNLAVTLQELGRLNESASSYKKAIVLRHDFAQAHCNLGVIMQEIGHFDAAVASYKQAITLDPNYAEANYNLGVMLQQLGKLDNAAKHYNRAIKLKPDYAEALNNLGNTLKDIGRLDEANQSYSQAIRLRPDYAEAHNNLGNALLELGRLDQAKTSCNRAIAIKPAFSEAHNNLGNVFKELRRFEEAKTCYNKAISLKTNYALPYSNLSKILYHTGSENLALENIRIANILAPASKDYQLMQSVMEAKESRKNISAKTNAIRRAAFTKKTTSSPLVFNRAIETELLTYLYKLEFSEIDELKRQRLLASGKDDPRYGNGKCSKDFNLFHDSHSVIQKLKKDLTKIMKEAVNTDVYIYDSFLNILGAGGGTTIHNHINALDNDIGFDLAKQKYSLVYYLAVGDQNCSQPGHLKLYEPSEEILPSKGMILIFPATRKHSAIYNGKTDRIMVGANFYSL